VTLVRIAVLGTGTMGAPIAENLARAGHAVVVWNRTRARAEAVRGATVADTPADAARGAEAVLTMLADGEAVEETVGGIDSLPLWIQMSTVGVEATEKLIETARKRSATLVDAPVLGSKEPAQQAELVILASGPEEVRARCEPIFGAIGKRTIWVGDAGAGNRLKVVVNSWLVALVTALAETIALARGLDLESQLFFDAIADGPLDFPYARLKGNAMIAESFAPSFSLRLAQKDANLALAAARRAGIELPVALAVAEQFERAVDLGYGDDDLAAVYLAVKRQTSA
jgi:3-hydroxyisobutyrate dehydrogenase